MDVSYVQALDVPNFELAPGGMTMSVKFGVTNGASGGDLHQRQRRGRNQQHAGIELQVRRREVVAGVIGPYRD
jgi:hypothetical protein